KVCVELPGGDQMLQLLQAGVPAPGERLVVEVDTVEDVVELPGAAKSVPLTGEPRQRRINLREVDPVAPVVAAARPETRGAAGGHGRDRIRDLLDLVVLGAVADVEDLVVDEVARGGEHAPDRLGDVEPVYPRPPRRPVARHGDRAGGPGDAREVV